MSKKVLQKVTPSGLEQASLRVESENMLYEYIIKI